MSKVEYTVTIKDIPADDRPRERLQSFGPSSLSNAELVAILLGGGFRNVSALQLAQGLLQANDGLIGLSKANLDSLKNAKGMGLAKSCTLLAAFELGKRVASSSIEERPVITSPADAAALLMPRYGDLEKENVGILALDTKNHVIREEVITVGILDGSMTHPREVFRPALLANAAAVLMFHNHPSGDPTPSQRDIEITRRLREVGKLMGVELLDHLVVARNSFISLKEKGMI